MLVGRRQLNLDPLLMVVPGMKVFEQRDRVGRRHLKPGEEFTERGADLRRHAREEVLVGLVDEMVPVAQREAIGHPHADIFIGTDDVFRLRLDPRQVSRDPAVNVLRRGDPRGDHLKGRVERVEIRHPVARREARREPQLERHVGQAELHRRQTLLVSADRGAVSDALFNLLTNADKYGGDPVKIEVFVTFDEREARLTVRDNGAGIPLAEHKRIFQKFYRLDDRLSREREGSGLGLAIVKHVMKAHHGRVELVSQPGKGSEFSLVLPVVRR